MNGMVNQATAKNMTIIRASNKLTLMYLNDPVFRNYIDHCNTDDKELDIESLLGLVMIYSDALEDQKKAHTEALKSLPMPRMVVMNNEGLTKE